MMDFTIYLKVDRKIRPDIRYPDCTGFLAVFPAGFPASGF
jgi:hypothetical protein